VLCSPLPKRLKRRCSSSAFPTHAASPVHPRTISRGIQHTMSSNETSYNGKTIAELLKSRDRDLTVLVEFPGEPSITALYNASGSSTWWFRCPSGKQTISCSPGLCIISDSIDGFTITTSAQGDDPEASDTFSDAFEQLINNGMRAEARESTKRILAYTELEGALDWAQTEGQKMLKQLSEVLSEKGWTCTRTEVHVGSDGLWTTGDPGTSAKVEAERRLNNSGDVPSTSSTAPPTMPGRC
jgi:hypothetical protein